MKKPRKLPATAKEGRVTGRKTANIEPAPTPDQIDDFFAACRSAVKSDDDFLRLMAQLDTELRLWTKKIQ
jgi:hypothetical protein